MRFGVELVILPNGIYNLYLEYKDIHPHLKGKKVCKGLPIFKFFMQYGPPWIWAWKFG